MSLKKILLASAVAMVSSAVFMFSSYAAENISIKIGDNPITIENDIFEDNGQIYLPLRATLNACGFYDINYDNGHIDFTLTNGTDGVDISLNIGEQNIKFSVDSDNNFWNKYNGARTTTHPAILRNDVAYIPLGMFIRIQNLDAKNKDDYTVRNLNLLPGLEVIRKNEDGTIDVMLSKTTKAVSENPQDYLYEDENVLIGTAEELDKNPAPFTEINYYYYPTNPQKRILVDNDGKVIAVCPIDCQYHEAITHTGITYYGGVNSWNNAVPMMFTNSSEGINIFSNEFDNKNMFHISLLNTIKSNDTF